MFSNISFLKQAFNDYPVQNLMNHQFYLPGRVAQSVTCLATDASLTADPGVAS